MAMGLTSAATKHYHKLSNDNVVVISDSFSIANYESYVHAVCKKCGEKQTITLNCLNSQAIDNAVDKFCEMHRHEGNKVDCDPDMGIGGGGGVSTSFAGDFKFSTTASDNNTELILTIAKASNFNVNIQARTNSFRTRYRLHCNLCNTEMDLGTRIVTKQEIEDPTTVTSKFCIEHAHKPNIKTTDTANYRKFREE